MTTEQLSPEKLRAKIEDVSLVTVLAFGISLILLMVYIKSSSDWVATLGAFTSIGTALLARTTVLAIVTLFTLNR